MKSNILFNDITKRASLALALIALPLSSTLNATDYVTPEGGSNYISEITEANGSFTGMAGSNTSFGRVNFGNASGGRFTTTLDLRQSGGGESNASVYFGDYSNVFIDSILVNGTTARAFVSFYETNAIIDNAISFGTTTSNLTISDYSRVTVSSPYGISGVNSSVYVGYMAHATFRVNGIDLVTVGDDGRWTSFGGSSVNKLIGRDTATVDLLIIALTDSIKINELEMRNSSTLTFEVLFSDSAIIDILAGDGEFDLYMDDTFVISNTVVGTNSDIIYNIATSNDTYQWDVVDLGHKYVITNITHIIPEPSTYAAIFGALALGLAIYRRRK